MIVPAADVPPWAAGRDVADALSRLGAREVVIAQRRRDGVVFVSVMPLAILEPGLREQLERPGRNPFAPRRWILAFDADGTTAAIEARGFNGPRGIA